jgi:flagellar biosynthesis/type III secretory pathway protein FliH
VLREQLTTAGLDVQSVEIRQDPALGRGELRLQTDVGTIDARFAPRFERLAAALRDALP